MSSQLSTSKSIFSLLLFSLVLLCGSLYAEAEKGSTFKGMVGTYPIKLRWLCNKIKEVNRALKDGRQLPMSFKNRMILYGPPGNGKTMVVYKIA